MDNRDSNCIIAYMTTMAGVKLMLKQGIITTKEYNEIDTMIAQKHGLSLSVIYRLNPLI